MPRAKVSFSFVTSLLFFLSRLMISLLVHIICFSCTQESQCRAMSREVYQRKKKKFKCYYLNKIWTIYAERIPFLNYYARWKNLQCWWNLLLWNAEKNEETADGNVLRKSFLFSTETHTRFLFLLFLPFATTQKTF